jgi:hypothetical protein
MICAIIDLYCAKLHPSARAVTLDLDNIIVVVHRHEK